MQMTWRGSRLAATTLAALSLGAVGVAEAAQTKTKLSIEADDGTFTGSLSSSRGSCETDRKVTLFRKVGNATKKVGSDVSNDDGDWTVESAKTGKFFAVVKANSKCKGAVSKTVTVAEED